MNGRILAVDPGQKKLGISISDPSGTIANPKGFVIHSSMILDAAQIADLARENDVISIVVGEAFDEDGQIGPRARHAIKLAKAIGKQSELPVILWDESYSTQEARHARIALGANRKKRAGHLDDLAATVILQTYLDAVANKMELRNDE